MPHPPRSIIHPPLSLPSYPPATATDSQLSPWEASSWHGSSQPMPRRRSAPGPRERPHSARATQEKPSPVRRLHSSSAAATTSTDIWTMTNHAFQRYRDVDHAPSSHQSQATRRRPTRKYAWGGTVTRAKGVCTNSPIGQPTTHSTTLFPLPQSTNNLFSSHRRTRDQPFRLERLPLCLPISRTHGEMTRPPGGSGHLIIDTRLSPSRHPRVGGCVAHR